MAKTPPVCFGKSWEAKAVQCQGGLDPSYVNQITGSSRRDRCDWYTLCASRTSAFKLQNPQIIPLQQLVRRPAAPVPAQPAPQAHAFMQPAQQVARTLAGGVLQGMQQVLPAQPQPQQQPYYGNPAPMMVHPAAAASPWAVPANYPMPGAQIPSYLTVPEPVVEGQHWAVRLLFNVARSVFKATGHTLANYADHMTFGQWQAPAPPAQPQPQAPPQAPPSL